MLLNDVFFPNQIIINEDWKKWAKIGAIGLGALSANPSPSHVKNFIRTFIPAIKQANTEVLRDRKKIIDIISKDDTSDSDIKWLNKKMAEYKTKNTSELLKNLDIIPPSMILAQSAIESGWGQSELAKRNSFFGQKDWNNNSGYAEFKTPLDSIRGYIKNLNVHPSYSEMRDIRNNLRKHDRPISGIELIKGLTNYSTRKEGYINQLRNFIKSQGLDSLDKIPIEIANDQPTPTQQQSRAPSRPSLQQPIQPEIDTPNNKIDSSNKEDNKDDYKFGIDILKNLI